MLLDFLHLSRNMYLYLRSRAWKVGMLHWTWWLLKLTFQGRLYRALQPKLYATRNLYMHDFLKLHYNWDAYMGVQTERKSTFLTAIEQREEEARSLFAAQYWYRSCLWMSLSSDSSVSNKIPRYLYWSTYFTYWPPNFNNGVSVLFALLALNVIQRVLLQLKKSHAILYMPGTHLVFFATNVRLDRTHKYHQQTLSYLIRLHQYNTLL